MTDKALTTAYVAHHLAALDRDRVLAWAAQHKIAPNPRSYYPERAYTEAVERLAWHLTTPEVQEFGLPYYTDLLVCSSEEREQPHDVEAHWIEHRSRHTRPRCEQRIADYRCDAALATIAK